MMAVIAAIPVIEPVEMNGMIYNFPADPLSGICSAIQLGYIKSSSPDKGRSLAETEG
ncbi:MAG TPA: hypothetical protein VLH61_10505 [Bacteroidales bacterium]|nr:hypothetical protein [Bacteroidales bacterium]